MRQRFLCLVLATLVVISSAAARDLKTTDGQQVARVAVISRLGDRFHAVLETPPGFFSGGQVRRGEVLVPNWKVDEHIEQRIGRALAERFSVAPPTAGGVEGAEIWSVDDMVDSIRKSGPRSDIDAYVFVTTAINSSHYNIDALSLVPIWGLGIYRLDRILVSGTWVYAVFDVVILDAKTGTVIARQRARVAGEWNYASDIADDRLWPNEDEAPQPEQVAQIRDAITALVDKSVDWTVKKMELVH